MADDPVVSVLMPVAREREFLAIAIESVLTQTFTSLELILIDDVGQLADLRKRLPGKDPRAIAIACEGRGIADALNTGIKAARGRYVCRVDCDDLIPPDRIAKQVRWLEEHSEFAAVCGRMSTMTRDNQLVADVNANHQRGEITDELRTGVTRCSLCTFLMRIDPARELAGPFRRYFITAEDIDFQFRFGERSRVWFEPMMTYWYRLHDSSITHSQANNARIFFHETARQFQRQRLERAGQDDLDLGTPPNPPADDASRPFDSAQVVQRILSGSAWEKHREGRKAEAIRLGWRACMSRPASTWAWWNLAALVLKGAGNGPAKPRVTVNASVEPAGAAHSSVPPQSPST